MAKLNLFQFFLSILANFVLPFDLPFSICFFLAFPLAFRLFVFAYRKYSLPIDAFLMYGKEISTIKLDLPFQSVTIGHLFAIFKLFPETFILFFILFSSFYLNNNKINNQNREKRIKSNKSETEKSNNKKNKNKNCK